MAARATIPHSVPGRVRLKITGDDKEVADVLDAVQRVRDEHGVSSVRTDVRTGSALLLYDPESLDLEAAVDLLRKAHQALEGLVPPAVLEPVERSASHVAVAVRARFGHADESVLRATRGVVDLRMLLPIGLAGLSIRQFLRTGPNLKAIPWYALAYYSFDSFIKLHWGDIGAQRTRETP
jgi:hypothetical protein